MNSGNIQVKISDSDEVFITADKAGMEYLKAVLEKLPHNQGPAAHWHLSPEMQNLAEGSARLTISFVEGS
jgi:hypothetical protein